MIREYEDKTPSIDESAFIAESADVIGDVIIGKDSSIWFQTVVRGDENTIRIGNGTNIQDGSILHVTQGTHPLILMDQITVGHMALIHGCTIHSNTLIGMGSIILDGAEIMEESIIGAGSLVTEGTQIPSRVLAFGRPAKPQRDLTEKELLWIRQASDHYITYKERYRSM